MRRSGFRVRVFSAIYLVGASRANANYGASRDRARRQSGERVQPSYKLHVLGYFDPCDPILVAFQELKVVSGDPNRTCCWKRFGDFVAKQETANAFR
jgi:hypothetical protein